MINTVCRCITVAKEGHSFKDKVLCALLAAYPVIGDYRIYIKPLIYRLISNFSDNSNMITLSVIKSKKPLKLTFRKFNKADYISAGEFIWGSYQIPIATPKMIVDCGANIGIFSLLAATTFNGIPLTCYEPDKANLQLLKLNLKQNNINAAIIEKGVWSDDLTLYYHEQSSNTGYIDTNPPGFEIPCEFPKLNFMTWLKIDVEGAEHEVIPEMLRRQIYPYYISLEVHSNQSKGMDLKRILENAGYFFDHWPGLEHDCGVVNCTFKSRI